MNYDIKSWKSGVERILGSDVFTKMSESEIMKALEEKHHSLPKDDPMKSEVSDLWSWRDKIIGGRNTIKISFGGDEPVGGTPVDLPEYPGDKKDAPFDKLPVSDANDQALSGTPNKVLSDKERKIAERDAITKERTQKNRDKLPGLNPPEKEWKGPRGK
jgi:hypothetical protein